MSRRFAREEAFKLIYQIDIHKGKKKEVLDIYFANNTINETVKSYIINVVDGTFENVKTIDSLIEENSVNWKLERISKVDKAILRLAIYEILYRKDIPISVSINEAVELAKKFDNNRAASFINGILGSIQNKNDINK